MTRICLLGLLAVATGCMAASEPPAPVDPAPVVVRPAAAPPPRPAAPVSAQAVAMQKQYHELQHKELPKIVALDATADFVARMLQADLEVRSALVTLEKQGLHPATDIVQAATTALQKLKTIVNLTLPATAQE